MPTREKTILIIGTLDTKGEECLYIKDLVQKNGLKGLIIDPGSIGKPVVRGNISREDIAYKAGYELCQLVQTGDKGKIIQSMTDGLKIWVWELYRANQIHGVISVGGGQGTAMGVSQKDVYP